METGQFVMTQPVSSSSAWGGDQSSLEGKDTPIYGWTAPAGHRLLPPTAARTHEVHLHIGLDAFGRALDVRDPLIDIRDTRGMHPRTP